jgi:GDPmannose 4,6-dehydratase
MLKADKPNDFILVTNKTTYIRDFEFTAFKKVGINIKWVVEGINEKGIDIISNRTVVEISEDFLGRSK